MTEPILSLKDVHTHIQQHHILQGVSLKVKPGRATVLVGRNGAGKSTTLRTIMGLNPATAGPSKWRDRPSRTGSLTRLPIWESGMCPRITPSSTP